MTVTHCRRHHRRFPEPRRRRRTAADRTRGTAVGGPALEYRPGRWIANWDAENKDQWESAGRGIARRNLNWSIFAEFLGFVVWQLWSIVVVQLARSRLHASPPTRSSG